MIYAISDVHGDKKQAIKLLQEHDVIDNENNWIAGSSVLVVNGDSTDRGPDGIGTLRFFYNLTQQAAAKGGRVIHTMGNHDALILSIALQNIEQEYNYEHEQIFRQNGGKVHEAKSLSTLHDLRRYVQSFPLMCRIDDVLFQHVDGFFYTRTIDTLEEPEKMIAAINVYGRHQAQTSGGAWQLFYDLTNERYWQYNEQRVSGYLQKFDAKMVVHGHTGFIGDEPLFYLNNTVVNIDAVMSSGYRKDNNRGCVLVLDKPGKNIVIHG